MFSMHFSVSGMENKMPFCETQNFLTEWKFEENLYLFFPYFISRGLGFLHQNPSGICFWVCSVPSAIFIQTVLACFVHPPKKLINCLAFSWNVAIPVSQGNVVINIITDIIIAVKCYIAGDVGHVPRSPQTSFYLDFQPNISVSPH